MKPAQEGKRGYESRAAYRGGGREGQGVVEPTPSREITGNLYFRDNFWSENPPEVILGCYKKNSKILGTCPYRSPILWCAIGTPLELHPLYNTRQYQNMSAMVFGRIASVLEKQKGTPSDMFTVIVARLASISIALT